MVWALGAISNDAVRDLGAYQFTAGGSPGPSSGIVFWADPMQDIFDDIFQDLEVSDQ